MGLADRCVPMESFDVDVMKIAAQYAALPPSSLSLAKRLINHPMSLTGLKSYLEYENEQLLKAMNRNRMIGEKR
jgi:enoyl-CoA hydratase/carnithine racemase